jgi:hypothetical protein
MSAAVRHLTDVYFIRPIGGGPVKIGVSRYPRLRLYEFMTWAPVPLEIAATINGPRSLEKRFHARFRHLHSHREWFRASPELDDVIDEINAGTFDTSALPASINLWQKLKAA